MRMLINNMAGRASAQIKGDLLGLDLSDRGLAGKVTEAVKQREAKGYSYEAADASFELLVRRMTGQLSEPFELVSWRVFTEEIAGREQATGSEATVKDRKSTRLTPVTSQSRMPSSA